MRGSTARNAIKVLVAVLLCLQFFASTASFASAHTDRHAEVQAEPGNGLTGTALRGEAVTHRGCGPAGDPTDPLRTRDRHRGVTAVHAPPAPERPPQETGPTSARPPVPSTSSPHPARSRAAHTPAALQVFRC
ncbi:hypothetical protein [Streptomyces poonensis]|uniref:Secreted protein n=1 Tax=Streptomyces poonensis TaxID=68255 RepID=A0A918PZQ9_9ACTN|nr:hypothetical protein [Streptomyces poonensis]GGZ26412.1 hypothetical protein GCM10010365_53480 [Streptomyces poonensis]GLJ88988.1 hypothetical protein GCM10017589_15880 [Streptomyces poonensis]